MVRDTGRSWRLAYLGLLAAHAAPKVSDRIAEMEHKLLEGAFGHDGCRWCVMESAYARGARLAG